MALKLPPRLPNAHVAQLRKLVTAFNAIPETNDIQRLFYLQRINYLLNKIPLDAQLFSWLNLPGPEGWLEHLNAYSINTNASFFVKGIQFAQAVAKHVKPEITLDTAKNEYQLMQERDVLLKNQDFEHCKERYIAICAQLNNLAGSDPRIKDIVDKHSEIHTMAHAKFEAIKGKEPIPSDVPTPSYKTKELGAQVNNFNFTLNMGDNKDSLVIRVEDRGELGLEQDLHSYEVSKYFIVDYAVFMLGFKDKQSQLEYKPVVFSQWANQGNLSEIAKNLKGTRGAQIASLCSIYFTQLNEFCIKLMAANAYHPDIKLTNFLVHNKLIKISDRKTLINDDSPFAIDVRSTPEYAPDEYVKCIADNGQELDEKVASETIMNMPQFMAYQVGMALKEFLILTQLDKLPGDFRNPDHNAAYYFKSPPEQIINLSLLVQELTRSDASKRLSIQQFQSLLKFRNLSQEDFYVEVEKELPSSTLGIQEDLKTITDLLNGDLTGNALITQANLIFNKLSASNPKETRLTRMAEKLAIKCYKEYSEYFFAESIETALLNKDWNKAPWYRQVIHWLSFGYIRVEKVTNITDIKDTMIQDLKSKGFQSHFPHLEFLPSAELNSLGESEAEYFKKFIYKNLEKILSQNPSKQDKPLSTDVGVDLIPATIPYALDTIPYPLATIVTSSTIPSVDSSGQDDSDSTEKNSPTSDTIVINQRANIDLGSVKNKRVSFFNPSTPDEDGNKTPKPRAQLTRVDSIRTSLFRGDGSNRRKAPPTIRPTVTEINWEPLAATEPPVTMAQ